MSLIQSSVVVSSSELDAAASGQLAADVSTSSTSESPSPTDSSSDDELHGGVLGKVASSDKGVRVSQDVVSAPSAPSSDLLQKMLAAAAPPFVIRNESEFYACHPACVVRHAGPLGYGLFTTEFLPAGTCVYFEKESTSEGGGHVRIEDFKTWDKDRLEDYIQYAWQVDEEYYSGYSSLEAAKQDSSTYLNHSCDPNLFWSDRADNKLITRRDVMPGEQLLLDYGTVESVFFSERGPQSGCLCGSALCRGRIMPDDYLNPELIERYGNHWMGYMLERRGIRKPYDDFDAPEWLKGE